MLKRLVRQSKGCGWVWVEAVSCCGLKRRGGGLELQSCELLRLDSGQLHLRRGCQLLQPQVQRCDQQLWDLQLLRLHVKQQDCPISGVQQVHTITCSCTSNPDHYVLDFKVVSSCCQQKSHE